MLGTGGGVAVGEDPHKGEPSLHSVWLALNVVSN